MGQHCGRWRRERSSSLLPSKPRPLRLGKSGEVEMVGVAWNQPGLVLAVDLLVPVRDSLGEYWREREGGGGRERENERGRETEYQREDDKRTALILTIYTSHTHTHTHTLTHTHTHLKPDPNLLTLESFSKHK